MTSTPPRTLPASWYTSAPLYQLEKRAVFLKAWYLLGPIVKFPPGTTTAYEFAGVQLTVSRPSTATAPTLEIQTSPAGDTLRHHTTPTGLVFTTISPLAPPFSDYFPGLEDTLASVDFTTRPHRRSLQYPGRFNWKTMVDGYQECLHCAYTHPAFSLRYPPTSYAVLNHHNWCQHLADPAQTADGLFLYFFPNCTLNVYGGGMTSFRVCPAAEPGETRMEFDYYHVAEGKEFEEYFDFVRQVAMEDFELCETAQGNLERGIYAEGVLNPNKENGVACKKNPTSSNLSPSTPIT